MCPGQVKLFAILSPVGPYFKDGFKPVKLYADTDNVRAWPGGVGNAKVGGNYGPAILPAEKAKEHGCVIIPLLLLLSVCDILPLIPPLPPSPGVRKCCGCTGPTTRSRRLAP